MATTPRDYQQLATDIINAVPTGAELAALSQDQIASLRRYGNAYDNHLYMATADWQPSKARERT